MQQNMGKGCIQGWLATSEKGTIMKNTIDWIKAHPLASFFALTLALMFILLFPPVYLYMIDFTDPPLLQILLLYMPRLAVYSPVLVGMLVTKLTLPDRSPSSAKSRWISFFIVWLIALVVCALDLRSKSPEPIGPLWLLILSTPIAVLPAFVFSSAFSRITSLREYLSTLVHTRGNLIWYLVALLTFPVIHIMGNAVTQLLTGEPHLSSVQLSPQALVTMLITFASVFFYSGGINEEGGWRGFAQRRLQTSFNPLVANLLLFVYLVVIHVPNDLIQYQDGGYLQFRIVLYPFVTILFGWVYIRTRGSILAPAIFHASMNSMNVLGTALPATSAGSVLLVLFAIFAILYDRMWKKLPKNHPAVYPAHGSEISAKIKHAGLLVESS
jgi:membrane protease YdiL (CAAX protease family)